jgi:hypothetical protein
MSTSYMVRTVVGVPLQHCLTHENIRETATKYNENTGTPYQKEFEVQKFRLLGQELISFPLPVEEYGRSNYEISEAIKGLLEDRLVIQRLEVFLPSHASAFRLHTYLNLGLVGYEVEELGLDPESNQTHVQLDLFDLGAKVFQLQILFEEVFGVEVIDPIKDHFGVYLQYYIC